MRKEAKGSRMAVRILSVMVKVTPFLLIGWVNAHEPDRLLDYLERGEFGIRKARSLPLAGDPARIAGGLGCWNLSWLLMLGSRGWVRGTVALCLPLGSWICCRRVPFAGMLEYMAAACIELCLPDCIRCC